MKCDEAANKQFSANLTRYIRDHGKKLTRWMWTRVPEQREDILSEEIVSMLSREGKAIQTLLTRGSATTAADLLNSFSMDQLANDLQHVAPKLWSLLGAVTTADTSTPGNRNKSLVSRYSLSVRYESSS